MDFCESVPLSGGPNPNKFYLYPDYCFQIMDHLLITIFTPTYNRATLLPRLYASLKNQSIQNFEWVVVDDGSSDSTEEVVKGFEAENRIPIQYIKKDNEGKHLAINKGVKLAQGDLFFIVDSDDYLTPNATQLIANYYPKIKHRDDFAGMSFRRGTSSTTYIGTNKSFEDLAANALDFRFKHRIDGDMAEVFKTSLLKLYPFPKILGEKFCSEGLIWNRIALKYKLLWTSHIIYIGEYLTGGLTDNSIITRQQSPQYAILGYSELSKMPIPFLQKIKAAVNYWRFAHFAALPFRDKWRSVNPFLSLIALPLSFIFRIKDPI